MPVINGKVVRSWDVDILDEDGSSVDVSFLGDEDDIRQHIDECFDIPGTIGVFYKNFTAYWNAKLDREEYVHFNDPLFTVKIHNSDLHLGKDAPGVVPLTEEKRRDSYFKQIGSK